MEQPGTLIVMPIVSLPLRIYSKNPRILVRWEGQAGRWKAAPVIALFNGKEHPEGMVA